MAFQLPTFNLICNIWRFGVPTTDPPVAIAACNLAWGRRVFSGDTATDPLGLALPSMTLLLPTGSDIQSDVDTNGSPDTVEVPAGSSRFYTVHYVDYRGAGFLNEHLGAVIVRIPGGGPIPPGGPILTETVIEIDAETGDFLETE